MRVPNLRWSLPLAATVIIVGASGAFGALPDNFTNPAAPLPGHAAIAHLTLTGARTGHFTGGVPNGAINVLGLDFAQSRPLDPQTHLPPGRPSATSSTSASRPIRQPRTCTTRSSRTRRCGRYSTRTASRSR